MKTWIVQKLTSRKFWVAVATIVSGLVMMFGYADTEVETITGAILSIGGAIGYMIAEGIVDAKNLGTILEGAEIVVDELKEKDGENE